MKQKKTQIIFYFFLLIILSFSAHTKIIDSPGFLIGSDYPLERFGELSTLPDHTRHPPISIDEEPSCPRNPGWMIRNLEDDCSAAQLQCIEGCLRCIPRSDCNAEMIRKKKVCHGVCQANFESCMGW